MSPTSFDYSPGISFTEEDITPDGQMVLNDGNVIMFRTLDLNQPFDGIKNQLEELIRY